MMPSAALTAGRRAAEALMTDTCKVERKSATGATTQDPTTGTTVPVMDTVLASSKCKLQMPTVIARPQEAGGRTSFMSRLELHLPAGTTATLQADDRVTITAVGALSDVHLVGRSFRVVGIPAKSFATALRYEVQEYT